MVGRGTRLHPSKRDCLILDITDATERHELSTVAELLDLSGAEALLKHRSVLQVLRQRQATSRGEPEQQVLGVGVDLQAFDVGLFNRSIFRWIVAGDRMRLPLANGGVNLIPAGEDRWEVWLDLRGQAPQRLDERPLPIDWAQAVAEEYVRGHGGVIALKDAAWRRRAASPGQLETMRKLGLQPASDLTAGEASDRIAEVVHTRALRRFQPSPKAVATGGRR